MHGYSVLAGVTVVGGTIGDTGAGEISFGVSSLVSVLRSGG
jgi:hypothetical protein